MTSPLNPLIVQRIAYSRFLFNEGLKYSRLPAPLSATALLAFHDAVENFLGTAADHLGVEVKPGISFVEYWGQLKARVELPGKTAMTRLNNARVALKHHGNFPSPQTVDQSREAVESFFVTATPLVFGVDFDAIDMIDLVTFEATAQLLREAQTHADVGDYVAAMAGLSLAFERLIGHYVPKESFGARGNPLAFGGSFSPFDFPHNPRGATEKALVALRDAADKTREALQVISLGIDFVAYSRFLLLTPRVHSYFQGPPRYAVTELHEALGPDDYAEAKLFVVQTSLQAAAMDQVLGLANQRYAHRHIGMAKERAWEGGASPQDSNPPESSEK